MSIAPPIERPQRVREVWVCISPKAGTGVGRDELPKLIELLEPHGITCHQTQSIQELRGRFERVRQQAGETITEIADDEVVVIAAGGDGTVALVADNTPAAVPIIPMPMGTENLLARYFGHTGLAEDVVRTLIEGHAHQLDAGRANGRLFLVVASAGFDAEVVRAVDLRRRGHIRRLTYAGPIIRALRRYRFPAISIDVEATSDDGGKADLTPPLTLNSTQRCGFAMVFNLPRYGGFLDIEPDAVGDDHWLDLVAFERGSVLDGLRYLMGIVIGRHRRFRDVVRRRVRSLTLSAEGRVPYQLDGDYAGHLPVKIELLASRVRLLLPANPLTSARRPVVSAG